MFIQVQFPPNLISRPAELTVSVVKELKQVCGIASFKIKSIIFFSNAGLLLFNEHPEKYFSGATVDLVIHKNEVGKDYIEKIFTGSIIQQIRDVLQYFKTNIIEELVVKSAKQAESIRFFNYPFQAIEEAVVNAIYHKSYERENPVEIQIHKDKIEILSFPGPMPPVDQAMLQKQRVVARDYRNRKIGGFLKELKLTEGRGTGLPIIHKSLEENGSPPPIFETDENNAYFLCILPIHSLTETILGQADDLRWVEDKTLLYNSLNKIDTHLRSQQILKRDQVEPKFLAVLESPYLKVLKHCEKPQNRLSNLENLDLYNNSRNFENYIKHLIDIGWINLTIPDKPRSKNQKYYTTDIGKKLLETISIDSNLGIKRVSVVSSNIASVGYDAEKKLLEIEFHHGAVYQYFDVQERVYEELMNSAAKGSYFMNEIKSKFAYEQK